MNANIKTYNDLRGLFLKFFESKGHAVIPSASVIPENDPTVLFPSIFMRISPFVFGLHAFIILEMQLFHNKKRLFFSAAFLFPLPALTFFSVNAIIFDDL